MTTEFATKTALEPSDWKGKRRVGERWGEERREGHHSFIPPLTSSFTNKYCLLGAGIYLYATSSQGGDINSLWKKVCRLQWDAKEERVIPRWCWSGWVMSARKSFQEEATES